MIAESFGSLNYNIGNCTIDKKMIDNCTQNKNTNDFITD
jgi:hypothetical protein